MAAAPEPAEVEPCPEPPAHRLSVAELDRELDSRSELVRPEPPCRRRHGRAAGAVPARALRRAGGPWDAPRDGRSPHTAAVRGGRRLPPRPCQGGREAGPGLSAPGREGRRGRPGLVWASSYIVTRVAVAVIYINFSCFTVYRKKNQQPPKFCVVGALCSRYRVSNLISLSLQDPL